MAEPCTACTGNSYSSSYKCPPQKGISVLQPACQALIDGNVVNNPCYNPVSGISTWTFRFFTDCSALCPISSILIPICIDIEKSSIAVEEKIDSFGRFMMIPFTLSASDAISGNAPSGFQWFIIDNKDRFDRGAYVEYRISIEGNYPESLQPIRVVAGQNDNIFVCSEGGFKVPGCIIPDRIELETDCYVQIHNNTAALLYNAKIQNKGAAILKNIQYQDILNYDGANIDLGLVVLPTEPLLQITSSVPSALIISGTLPPLVPNQAISIGLTVPVLSFAQPGTFIFTNMTTSASESITVSDTCTANIEVVKLTADKHISCEDINQVLSYTTLTSMGASPATNVSLVEEITIPKGVAVQFSDLSEGIVTFSNGSPVPLNMDITDTSINVVCRNIPIPAGGGVRMSVVFYVTSTSAFKAAVKINAALQMLSGINSSQIYLIPCNVPSSASISISGTIMYINGDKDFTFH